jgi:hypothetical protein
MRLEAIQFFQPVVAPTLDGKRAPLLTSAKASEYDITLQGHTIQICLKNSTKSTYATLFNTCWYIPLEVTDEPVASPSPAPRAAKAKVKPNTVAEDKLPRTNRVHPGPSET